MAHPSDTVRAVLSAYLQKDRGAIERLIAEDYAFTSPLDNALDRETYFATCWPNSEMMTGYDVIHETVAGEFAFIVYEGLSGSKRFRNFELHRVRGGQIVSTEVYFGWNVPHPVPPGEHRNVGRGPAS